MTKHAIIDHSRFADQANASTNYTMYAVFRAQKLGTAHAADVLAAVAAVEGLSTRGWYDIAGFRADADVLIWWHASTTEALQAAYRAVVDTSQGALEPVWSNIGVHRAAEFNRGHVPAFLAEEAPKKYVCVYPFVRSHDWYLMPAADRAQMLRDHGAAARDYPDVLANTVAAFALGDYEWLLAFEADDLLRIVDLMRELRDTEARRYVTEETPFFTGPRICATEFLERVLPR